EGDHDDEPDQVGDQPGPAPPSVDPVRLEDLGDRVVALADDEVVGQVDGRPRDEEVQHQQEEVAEVGQEVLGGEVGPHQRDQGGDADGGDPQRQGGPDASQAVDRRDQRQGAAVHVQGGDRDQPDGGDQQGDRPEPGEQVVGGGLDGGDRVEVLAGGGGDARAQQHHPDAPERTAPEGPLERTARGHVSGQVAGVVRHVD